MGRDKKPLEGNNPFKLRMRPLKDGRFSLFIDHFHKGKHTYKFLKLYLLPETSEVNRRENKRILKIAEQTLTEKRIESIVKHDIPKPYDTPSEILLSDFITSLIQEYKKAGKAGYKHLETAKSNLQRFSPKISLSEIDTKFCISYFLWLNNEYKTSKGKNLSEMTVHIYFRKIGVILTSAFKRGYLKENVWKRFGKEYKTSEPQKEKRILTIEELKILEKSDYKDYPIIRSAFLFSCFCGFRISDVRDLKWEDITLNNGNYFISKKIKKTGRFLTIPLNKKAYEHLPQKRKKGGPVFDGLPTSAKIQFHLNKWIERSGLNGHIHFHISRHTFASLLISSGTDLYVASYLMGHSDIRTTQRYAKVNDKEKEEAIELLDTLMGDK